MEDWEVEDSEQGWFETKRSLHDAKVPFFLRTISERHIRRPALSNDVRTFEMDIPAAFVRDHGEQMKPSATIQAAGDGDGGQVWPVKIHIVATPFRARVGFNRGFHKFLLTNDLNVGDRLIFSLPAMSKFVVYIFKLHKIKAGRRSITAATPSSSCTPSKKEWMPFEDMDETIFSAPHHHHPVKVEPGCEVNDLDATRGSEVVSKKIKEMFGVKGEDSRNVKRQIVDEEPESGEEKKEEEGGEIRSSQISFRKVVSVSSASGRYETPACFSRLELPIEFVRCYAGKYVESDAEYTLEVSPTGRTWQVDCQRTGGGRIHFTYGWNEFANANQLKPGESLIFTLDSPRRFLVQILQPDQPRRSEEEAQESTRAWHKRKSRVDDDDDDDDDDHIECDFQLKKPHRVTMKHDNRCFSESPKSEDRSIWSLKNSNRRISGVVQQWARNRIAGLKAGRVDTSKVRKHNEKRSIDQQEDEDEEEEHSFIKKLPDSSSTKCCSYPFMNIPAVFSRKHHSWFPEQVYLQGPKSTECFPVKCAGSGTIKSFTTGWKSFFNSNSLESGDVLRFTHTTKASFSVSYYL